MNDSFFDPSISSGAPLPSNPAEPAFAQPPASPALGSGDAAGESPSARSGADPANASLSDPREIVEYYPPLPRPQEVVETYVQPRRLPGRAEASPAVEKAALSVRSTIPTAPAGKKARSRRGLLAFVICLATVMALAICAFCLDGGLAQFAPPSHELDQYPQNEDWEQEEVSITPYPYGEGATMDLDEGHGSELTIQEIYRLVNPAVVTVMAQLDYGASVGTGVIFRQDGYVLTNYHVVAGSDDCNVTLASGKTYEAKYVGGDSGNDVAVLKLNASDLPAAVMGDSDSLTVGDTVYAIGNPLGVELRGTLTDGIVSAINRDVDVQGRTMSLIQTNAALNEGNSGGPLINVYGQVVGVNTIKMMSFTSNVEGLGFALPMRSVQKMVNDILAFGEVLPEPRLGVSVYDLPKGLPDGSRGVEVQDVSAGSAADLAGVKAGDVIVSAAGQSVSERHTLLSIRRQFRIGDDLPMTIWRDGEYLDVVLHLVEAFEEDSAG